jgi:hypothetical protein
MLGLFIKSFRHFEESLRDEDTTTKGLAGVIEDVPSLTLTTGGGTGTLTADQLAGGFIIIDTQDAQSTATPTATLIRNSIKGAKEGSGFLFVIKNSGDSTMTLTAGTGVTITGTATIATNNSKLFLVRVTNMTTPAVTVYSIGTFVH